MNRRTILISLCALPIAACATTDKTVAQVASDVNLIASGLVSVANQLGPMAGISADTLAIVITNVQSIQALAKSIGAVTSVAEAQPLVQKLETYLNTVVSALANVPLLPPAIVMALKAASILLPVVETMVGLLVTSKSRAKASDMMSPDEARLILRTSSK